MKKHLIGFLLILGTLALLPDMSLNLRCNRQLLTTWITMIAFAMFFLKNPYLRCFLIWTVLRVILSLKNPGEFYITLNTIFIFLIAYQLLMNEVKDTVHLLNVICVVTLIQLIWMGMQFFRLWVFIFPLNATGRVFLTDWPLKVLFTVEKYPLMGLMGNINISSALLVLGLPAFFRKKWLWGIPLVWVGLIGSQSLGGIIPAGIATLWLIWNTKYNYWILSGLGMVGIIYLLRNNITVKSLDTASSGRFELWWAVFRSLILKHWIVGWGVGSFKVMHRMVTEKIVFDTLHNEWLEIWFEQGVIGVGLIIGFIGATIKKFWFMVNKTWVSKIAFIGVLTVVLNGGVNFLFHVSPGIIGMVWFVILQKEVGNDGQERKCLKQA